MRKSIFGGVVLSLTIGAFAACSVEVKSGSPDSDTGGSGGGSSTGATSSTGANGGESSGGMGGAGTGGDMGGNGTGGDMGGAGGNMGGAGGDMGGAGSTCAELTAAAFETETSGNGVGKYFALSSPDQGDAGQIDRFTIEFWGSGSDANLNGEQTGSFDLAEEGNYQLCSRCLLVQEDAGTKLFYPESGTLFIDDTSKTLSGTVHGTLTDVKLVEVTIDSQTLVSTPVPNGECRHVASATLEIVSSDTQAPDGWTCQDSFYSDTDCDCGCGAPDPACADTTAASCDYCNDVGSCSDAECAGLDPNKNSVCL